MTVCLDPGHGGRDPGAVADGHREADLALLLARRMKEGLIRAGHRVVWTRTDDRGLTLARRVQAAREAGAELFVSVHCNAGPPAARGIEWFHAEGDAASRMLAQDWASRLQARIPVRVRGVKPDSASPRQRLFVLRGNRRERRALLVEAGFITSPADRELLLSPGFGLALGDALAEALRG